MRTIVWFRQDLRTHDNAALAGAAARGANLLYAFVIVCLDRRDLVWINFTTSPTAEWIARQLTEAFPWDAAPRYPHLSKLSERDCSAAQSTSTKDLGL